MSTPIEFVYYLIQFFESSNSQDCTVEVTELSPDSEDVKKISKLRAITSNLISEEEKPSAIEALNALEMAALFIPEPILGATLSLIVRFAKSVVKGSISSQESSKSDVNRSNIENHLEKIFLRVVTDKAWKVVTDDAWKCVEKDYFSWMKVSPVCDEVVSMPTEFSQSLEYLEDSASPYPLPDESKSSLKTSDRTFDWSSVQVGVKNSG